MCRYEIQQVNKTHKPIHACKRQQSLGYPGTRKKNELGTEKVGLMYSTCATYPTQGDRSKGYKTTYIYIQREQETYYLI